MAGMGDLRYLEALEAQQAQSPLRVDPRLVALKRRLAQESGGYIHPALVGPTRPTTFTEARWSPQAQGLIGPWAREYVNPPEADPRLAEAYDQVRRMRDLQSQASVLNLPGR